MGKKSGIGAKKVALDFDPFAALDALADLPDPLALFESDSLIQDTEDIEDEPREALFYKDHRPSKREFKAIQANEYLHQVLAGIPEPATTWHAISNSRFNFWSFVPSVIKYLGDYTTTLYCATWTTNNLNTKDLIGLYDAGKIGAITFVVGRYFQAREEAVYNFLASKLLERKQRIIVGEHHAKILLLQNEDNYITIESSANLCANPRTEQFTYTNDKDLFHFYQSWFEGLAQQNKGKEKVA